MYEQHFGLRKAPFLAEAAGTDVFVGPPTAQAMASLKKALESPDAVVTVSGPAGSGKTTTVNRALDALVRTRDAVHIGRLQLNGQDVLEFLLEKLGAGALPHGTIRQFAAFRTILGELEAAGKHVVIVVEDALRAGAETLAELEALTAADSGDSGGAALVLMGDDRLAGFLEDPQLARLVQRIRGRQTVEPLKESEMRGYLMHCFRLAGADFEQVFDAGSAALISRLCDGIPRVANTVVTAAMASAARDGILKITTDLVAATARDDCGLELDDGDAVTSAATPKPVPEPLRTPQPDIDAEVAADPVPELIQDTLPEIEALPRDPTAAQPAPEAPEPTVASAATDLPEWDRDPTQAELRPDLDALEKAMAVAQGTATTNEPAAASEEDNATTATVAEETQDEIPEITLDKSIESGIANNLIDEPGEIGPIAPETPVAADAGAGKTRPEIASTDEGEPADIPAVPVLEPEPAVNAEPPAKPEPQAKPKPPESGPDDAELGRIAAGLAEAKTIEDVDDKLAETLFGEEFSAVAAQVLARCKAEASANEDAVEISLEMPATGGKSGLDQSASQRLKTVRALNARQDTARTGHAGGERRAAAPTKPERAAPPEPIEDQINTSITQTLKALSARAPEQGLGGSKAPDFDANDEEKSGFFNRFKRS